MLPPPPIENYLGAYPRPLPPPPPPPHTHTHSHTHPAHTPLFRVYIESTQLATIFIYTPALKKWGVFVSVLDSVAKAFWLKRLKLRHEHDNVRHFIITNISIEEVSLATNENIFTRVQNYIIHTKRFDP